jgi:hypothetical protein
MNPLPDEKIQWHAAFYQAIQRPAGTLLLLAKHAKPPDSPGVSSFINKINTPTKKAYSNPIRRLPRLSLFIRLNPEAVSYATNDFLVVQTPDPRSHICAAAGYGIHNAFIFQVFIRVDDSVVVYPQRVRQFTDRRQLSVRLQRAAFDERAERVPQLAVHRRKSLLIQLDRRKFTHKNPLPRTSIMIL